ncbi:DNA polymerase III subunit delta [Christensenellaceae bacterium OttesenSCG-928-K19]|nr:DNA polymerase III subunit delta [Christensenellaceae bacterium OttesenSCG-928-K19]
MQYQQAIAQLKDGQAKQYILFYGEDEFLKAAGVRQAVDLLDVQTPELNVSYFEERPDAGDVARAMETLPFMSDKRVIVIRNTDILSSACAAEYTGSLDAAVMPPGNYLVIGIKGKLDKRKKFYKKIEQQGMVVDCAPLNEKQLADFVTGEVSQRNLMITEKNARLLGELCGGDLQVVINEVEKLAAVSKGNITQQDIEKYVSKSLEYNVFKIHDNFCSRNEAAAKVLIDRLLEEEPNPVSLISLLAGNFKQMLVARACKDAGFSERKTIMHIMEETGAKEWSAKRAIGNCKSFSAQKLRHSIYRLGQIDFDAKQGGVVLQTDLFALLVGIYNR